MKLTIDISKNFNHQFQHYMGGKALPNGFVIDPAYGSDEAKAIFLELPAQLELYHFGLTRFKEPIEMHSWNPSDSAWLFIHINLSLSSQKKRVNAESIYFQRKLPIGILFCGPGLEMHTVIPAGVPSEVLSIRFPRDFVQTYLPEISQAPILNRPVAYEDIDDELDQILTLIISNMDNKLMCHAQLLKFLHAFFHKISRHQSPQAVKKIHPEDLKHIMAVSSLLRNPTDNSRLTLEELASRAHMGLSKFKESFKLVFGLAPLQYRQRIRMEYAREALMTRRSTATDLSYALGYAHPSNFSSAFKKHFGKLPSDY